MGGRRADTDPTLRRGDPALLHIEILKHASKGFQIRVIDADGRTVAMLTYPTIKLARGVARALTVAYGLPGGR
jgi:hypothetical protein